LRVPGRRPRAVFVALLATILLATVLGPAATLAHAPGIDRFLAALGHVESGGNYSAVNPVSGAYGKYQIMPANWPGWAKKYLGNAKAKPTPANQEKVARSKVHELHHWLGTWRRVAYWWLTGSTRTSGWSTYATRYVKKVMDRYGRTDAASGPVGTRYSEKSRRIEYTGTWLVAGHRNYAGGEARQASRTGQTATFTFTGTRVSWYGPVGPTRGKAKVYIDGAYVRTVDLYASRFKARNIVFAKNWAQPATRTLTIEVLGTKGRPVVSIDEFVVRD
jgi:hypothetical protein